MIFSWATGCSTGSSPLTEFASAAPSENWVATWSASPAGNSPDTEQLAKNTIREVVHVTVGGERIRVRLSNVFGRRPLAIGSVHVALRDTAERIVPGSDHVLSFDGMNSLSIPAGGTAASDGIDFRMPPMTDIAVSIFVTGTMPSGTAHPVALQTSYLGAGDQTSSEKMVVTGTLASWPFLSGVDVFRETAGSAVVAFGDSLTNGSNSSPDSNRRWVDHLALRLSASSPEIAVVNAGISGNRLLHDGYGGTSSLYGESGIARFRRDVLEAPGAKYAIVLLGINDIVQPGPYAPTSEAVSAAQLTSGLQTLVDRAHAQGLKIVLSTITPLGGPGAPLFSVENEAKRQTVNQWIRSFPAADGIIDFDAALRDPSAPSRMLPVYDSGDHLHPNDAGHQAMADAIDLSLFSN